MNRKTRKQSQKNPQSAKQRSQELEKKELTLEDLASVTGGFEALMDSVPDASVKLEDRAGNKGEAE